MQHYSDKNAINWTWVYIWQGRRSFGYDTIAEAAMTHISYVNKSNRLYKQHHNDKNAINWTWVYIFGSCCVLKRFFFPPFFKIQYNKYNTIIQQISTPIPTADNIRIQIYMLMLYIHNRQKRYIHTDIHTDKELDKVLHRLIFALHKEWLTACHICAYILNLK